MYPLLFVRWHTFPRVICSHSLRPASHVSTLLLSSFSIPPSSPLQPSDISRGHGTWPRWSQRPSLLPDHLRLCTRPLQTGRTSLIAAAQEGNLAVARLLLEYKAEVKAADKAISRRQIAGWMWVGGWGSSPRLSSLSFSLKMRQFVPALRLNG